MYVKKLKKNKFQKIHKASPFMKVKNTSKKVRNKNEIKQLVASAAKM